MRKRADPQILDASSAALLRILRVVFKHLGSHGPRIYVVTSECDSPNWSKLGFPHDCD